MEEYISAHGPWTAYLGEHSRGDLPGPWLQRWKGDGIIARVENPEIASALAALQVPVVNLSFAPLLAGAPNFTTDNEGIAELAASHFLERGFEHFAYCGRPEFVWSIDRGEAFVRRLAAFGKTCAVFEPPDGIARDSDEEIEGIAAWLRTLPKPVAVFACYDFRGQQVLDACSRAGLRVPDEAAVLGVDNDKLLCALSPPPLSSVIPNAGRTGWLAAEALDLMMRGEAVPAVITRVPPLGLEARHSTETMAVNDPEVADVIRYIREHACEGLTVAEVLRRFPMRRSLLDWRIKTVIGRTPHREIIRLQVAHAKHLLSHTSLPRQVVAKKCGFGYAAYLGLVFKREVGMTPVRYRKAQKLGR